MSSGSPYDPSTRSLRRALAASGEGKGARTGVGFGVSRVLLIASVIIAVIAICVTIGALTSSGRSTVGDSALAANSSSSTPGAHGQTPSASPARQQGLPSVGSPAGTSQGSPTEVGGSQSAAPLPLSDILPSDSGSGSAQPASSGVQPGAALPAASDVTTTGEPQTLAENPLSGLLSGGMLSTAAVAPNADGSSGNDQTSLGPSTETVPVPMPGGSVPTTVQIPAPASNDTPGKPSPSPSRPTAPHGTTPSHQHAHTSSPASQSTKHHSAPKHESQPAKHGTPKITRYLASRPDNGRSTTFRLSVAPGRRVCYAATRLARGHGRTAATYTFFNGFSGPARRLGSARVKRNAATGSWLYLGRVTTTTGKLMVVKRGSGKKTRAVSQVAVACVA